MSSLSHTYFYLLTVRCRSDGEQGRKRKRHEAQVNGLKRQLEKMLRQQVLVTGISARYITSGIGAADVVDQLLGGKGVSFSFFFLPLCLWTDGWMKGNDHLLGLERTDAVDDMGQHGKRGKKVGLGRKPRQKVTRKD